MPTPGFDFSAEPKTITRLYMTCQVCSEVLENPDDSHEAIMLQRGKHWIEKHAPQVNINLPNFPGVWDSGAIQLNDQAEYDAWTCQDDKVEWVNDPRYGFTGPGLYVEAQLECATLGDDPGRPRGWSHGWIAVKEYVNALRTYSALIEMSKY